MHGGYLNAYDFDPNYFAAVYHEFPEDYNTELYIGENIRELSIEYNMWYGLFQLDKDYTIIFEITVIKNGWHFFDIKASRNGTIIFYDDFQYEAPTKYSVYDPHTIRIDFIAHIADEVVELKLFIDNNLVVDRNYTQIYGAEIHEMLFGIWEASALYDMYIDNIVEKIIWSNQTPSIMKEDFDDLSTNYFQLYVFGTSINDYNVYSISSYPIILDDGKIAFVLDHI